LLVHVLDVSRALGADDIAVVYGYGGEAVQLACDGDGLRWVLQAEQLGTGHAVQQAMPGTPDGNRVLILYGDVPLLTLATLQRLVDATANDEASVLTIDVDDPTGYGRIIRVAGEVTASIEEKDASEKQRVVKEINTGIMVAPEKELRDWLNAIDNDNAQGEYYLTDVVALAVADGVTVNGVKANEWVEVMGINDKRQLAEAERALQKRQVNELMDQGVGFADPSRVDIRGKLSCGKDVFIDVNAVFEGDVSLGDGTRIESNNLIRDSRLGVGTILHSNCHVEIGPFARLRPGAELANNVKIGNFVEIKKSTIADGSKVNHLTYIGDAEIGTDVNVGAGTITVNYDGANKHKTTIGDNASIGSGVNLVAPIEIGKGATIGAGSTITRPVPDGQLVLERSKQVSVPGWKRPTKK
ncbi:MAG: bifunctional UDP-N-acetylglucosamine diphosphorylase/glucosamine-1-phosphate N-acetyltransferase GlmU, partial [Proteobacteria bacterium]|nr:bifunctional UDP-N-acetylglucosamine diphosphorylase/glucosamine-1-phosphate N-acetyltransferase GlmU [Pseudomonadota bacterium]